MPQSDDGGPTFPRDVFVPYPGMSGAGQWCIDGAMSLRDWFAGQALAALRHVGSSEGYAQEAYAVADAMLAERAQREAAMPDDFKPEWVEALMAARFGDVSIFPPATKEHMREAVLRDLRMLRDLLERDGWQVVPKVGHWTREMNVAFCEAMNGWHISATGLIPDDIMNAAFAAAPSPWSASDE